MRRSLLVLAIVIQVLGLFIFENMRSLFKNLEKNEVAAIIAQSDLQAELHVQRTLLRLPRPGRGGYFDQILPLPRPESGKQVILSGKERLLQIKKPLGEGSGLLFKKVIRSAQLDQFAALKNILTGLIFFLGIFIAVSGLYFVVLMRKKGPEQSPGAGSPFQDYLVEMKNTQQELQDLVAEQNRATCQKEELNKSIINTVHLGVIFLSAADKIEIFNPAAQKLFNRSFASAKNNSLAEVLQEHPAAHRLHPGQRKEGFHRDRKRPANLLHRRGPGQRQRPAGAAARRHGRKKEGKDRAPECQPDDAR